MIYACPTWDHASDAHLSKLLRLPSGVLGAIGNLDRCIPVRELHVVFKVTYVYDYITQAEVIVNRVNTNLRGIGQGKARHVKYKRLKLGGGQTCDRSAD
jgi:hypothetical protein